MVVFLARDSSPGLILILFFAALAIFMGTDALAAVAWFDILGRAIPPTRRGRLFGAGQIVLGLTTIGVGAVVKAILGADGLPFPGNYALLFLLASLSFSASWLAISFLREPAHPAQTDRLPWRAFLLKLWTLLGEDRAFRQVTIVRLLVGLAGMAIPFYIVYAIDVLETGEEAIGFFLSAQMIGSALAGFIKGYLSERSGSKAVIQLSNALALSSPILALSLPAFKLGTGLMPVCIYAFIFAAIGAVNSSLYTRLPQFRVGDGPVGGAPHLHRPGKHHQRPAPAGAAPGRLAAEGHILHRIVRCDGGGRRHQPGAIVPVSGATPKRGTYSLILTYMGPPISPGELEFTLQVQVTYVIK